MIRLRSSSDASPSSMDWSCAGNREQAHVIPIDLGELGDVVRLLAVVRCGVKAFVITALREDAARGIAAHLEREHGG